MRTTLFINGLALRVLEALRAVAALTTFVTLAALTALALTACRPVSVIPSSDDDGGGNIPGPDDEKTVSIALLKTRYNGAPVEIVDEWRISGAVISSDRHGNFHKTLVLDDGTGGIEISLDMDEIFKRFMIHTRAAVRCNGLWLGSYGGTLRLGAAPFGDYEVQPLSEVETAEHIAADAEFYGEVLPRVLTFDALDARHVSTFAAFENVSFAPEEHGLPWAETDVQAASATDRHLVDLAGGRIVVRTSRYAGFASWPLPVGEGRIEGVLGVFNGTYQLVVNDSQAFHPTRTAVSGE